MLALWVFGVTSVLLLSLLLLLLRVLVFLFLVEMKCFKSTRQLKTVINLTTQEALEGLQLQWREEISPAIGTVTRIRILHADAFNTEGVMPPTPHEVLGFGGSRVEA